MGFAWSSDENQNRYEFDSIILCVSSKYKGGDCKLPPGATSKMKTRETPIGQLQRGVLMVISC